MAKTRTIKGVVVERRGVRNQWEFEIEGKKVSVWTDTQFHQAFSFPVWRQWLQWVKPIKLEFKTEEVRVLIAETFRSKIQEIDLSSEKSFYASLEEVVSAALDECRDTIPRVTLQEIILRWIRVPSLGISKKLFDTPRQAKLIPFNQAETGLAQEDGEQQTSS